MKTNKVFKWLYGVFMFLPMLAIGVTCAYVTFNKNAKDSYSDTSLVSEVVQIQNSSQIQVGDVITFKYVDNQSSSTSPIFRFTELSFDLYEKYPTLAVNNYDGFLVYGTSNNGYWYYGDSRVSSPQPINFDFTFVAKATPNTNPFTNFAIYTTKYVPQKLDNAFYYAVDQFNESGFNKVDFVSYFDMFYNNTSIWTTFANTYMNYVLFVSLAFFIPRVLFWFINFAFSLVDGFSNKYKEW